MELQNLDQQLKMAIQNHQVLVTKMKTDPQNGALQKQLHELQSQIKGLSEKQKQVVQQLRKELEIKQHQAAIVVTTMTTATTTTTTQSTNNVTPPPPSTTPITTQSNKLTQNLIKSTPLSLTTKRPDALRGPTKGITVSAAIILPNKVSITATPMAGVTANGNSGHTRPPSVPLPLPPPSLSVSSTTAPTIILRAVNSSSSSTSPVTVTSTNPAPPIRVPQYPPSTGRSVTTTTAFVHLNTQRSSLVSGLTAAAATTTVTTTMATPIALVAATVPVLLPSKPLITCKPTTSSSLPPPILLTSVVPAPILLLPSVNTSLPNETKRSLEEPPTLSLEPSPSKSKLNDADSMKSNFMAALGLITHDTLTELQTRRSERKRRTTANPQFSYGNWEHPDRKSSTNYLSGSLPPGFKRPRGRPRIGSSTTMTESRPSTPDDELRNGTLNGLQSLCNGTLVKDSDCCVICREKINDGHLICDLCSRVYHRNCLSPQMKDSIEENESEGSQAGGGTPWFCPKCLNKKKRLQEWPGSLAVVHSYLAHKATKEEEKRKLVKRSSELKAERSQLQDRAKQLGDALSQQAQKRSDIMSNTKETMESIDRIKNAIRVLQAS